MNKRYIIADNRGLSLVELVVVIAIMAVLIGLLGFSVSMLFGNEAKQAATKMDAQLNDIKTGAMSRASEYMIVRYIDVDLSGKSKEDMAKLGVDKSGYYVEKRIDTITNDPAQVTGSDPNSVKWSYGGAEYTRIGGRRVEFKVDGNGLASPIEILTDGSNGLKLEYDRRTGRLNKVKVITVNSPNSVQTTAEEESGGLNYTEPVDSDAFTITQMSFKSGLRTYMIDFVAETGRHTVNK